MSDHPAPKAVLLAITIEAHDLDDARRQLDAITFRLAEAQDREDHAFDVTSGGGWTLRGDIDPTRTEEDYTSELMAWWERRHAARLEARAAAIGDTDKGAVTDHIFHAKDYDGSVIWRNAAGDEAALGDGDDQ